MFKKVTKNYYIKSFFWGSLSKIIKAVVNFISVPLLLKCYGESDYGILSLATAANAYIALLDLGMNTGAIKYFSQWKAEKKEALIDSVARTNITFYGLVGVINALILVTLGIFGGTLFSLSAKQFETLRICLFIIATFSIFNWISTAFNQLLTAFGKIAFVQQILCVTAILEIVGITTTFLFRLQIYHYFFITVGINAIVLFPYALNCRLSGYISSIKPLFDWQNFKTVFFYSLNIFVLALFQMTATNSRPVILGIFNSDSAKVSAEYRIISVVPSFILTLGGMISTILLPKASEAIAISDSKKKERIAYKGTFFTAILANILCIPFILCAKDFLSAYVGIAYTYLSNWLVLWCITVLIQIHTTPCNALILATGKTFHLVILSAVSCVISMCINAFFANKIGVGSAVIGYFVYVLIVIGGYYLFFYKEILELQGRKVFLSFFKPTLLSLFVMLVVFVVHFERISFLAEYSRKMSVTKCFIKGGLYISLFCVFSYFLVKWSKCYGKK